MNMTQLNRRPGLMADLDFRLPYVKRSKNAGKEDVSIVVSHPNKSRKMARYTISISNFFKELEHSNERLPETLSIGNDKAGNIFFVFDAGLENEMPIIRNSQKAAVVNSKAMIQKVLMVMKKATIVPNAGTMTLKGNLELVKGTGGNEIIYRFEPTKMITNDEAGGGDKIITL